MPALAPASPPKLRRHAVTCVGVIALLIAPQPATAQGTGGVVVTAGTNPVVAAYGTEIPGVTLTAADAQGKPADGVQVGEPPTPCPYSGPDWSWTASVVSGPAGLMASVNPANGSSSVTLSLSGATSEGHWQVSVTAKAKYTSQPCGDVVERSGSTTVDVYVVKVQKIQFSQPGGGGYRDMPGTSLYVAAGTSVTFKAILTPELPSGVSWPSGTAAWGGTCGASGSGETTTVLLSTPSTSMTDTQTITACCGTQEPVSGTIVRYGPDFSTFEMDWDPDHDERLLYLATYKLWVPDSDLDGSPDALGGTVVVNSINLSDLESAVASPTLSERAAWSFENGVLASQTALACVVQVEYPSEIGPLAAGGGNRPAFASRRYVPEAFSQARGRAIASAFQVSHSVNALSSTPAPRQSTGSNAPADDVPVETCAGMCEKHRMASLEMGSPSISQFGKTEFVSLLQPPPPGEQDPLLVELKKIVGGDPDAILKEIRATLSKSKVTLGLPTDKGSRTVGTVEFKLTQTVDAYQLGEGVLNKLAKGGGLRALMELSGKAEVNVATVKGANNTDYHAAPFLAICDKLPTIAKTVGPIWPEDLMGQADIKKIASIGADKRTGLVRDKALVGRKSYVYGACNYVTKDGNPREIYGKCQITTKMDQWYGEPLDYYSGGVLREGKTNYTDAAHHQRLVDEATARGLIPVTNVQNKEVKFLYQGLAAGFESDFLSMKQLVQW